MDTENLLRCFSRYLSKEPHEILNDISSYMISLVFNTNKPIYTLDPTFLNTLVLRSDCYNNGAVRLWVLGIHNDNIPEKAKTFYQTQPRYMKSLCIQTLCDQTLDVYTISHLIGEYYLINVYINNVHVQEMAGWDMIHSKKHKNNIYLKKEDEKFKIVLHKKKRIRKSKTETTIVTSKYALRINTPGRNDQLGLFVPKNCHVWVYEKMNSGTYTIYPPDGSYKISFDNELYLFTQDEQLLTIYKPKQPENMYFSIPSKTKLYLVEAKSERIAREHLTYVQ